MTAKEVLELAKKHKAVMVDLKFVDFPGTWQHFTIPIEELTDNVFTEGSGFDGSSIRGWQAINNSDMMVVPDPTTAVMDPFTSAPTISMICNVVDPITRENYSRDPRHVAQKAEKYLKSTKIGDVSYWGPEAEFFIFDNARYDQTSNSGYYYIDSDEGIWNSGKDGTNLGMAIVREHLADKPLGLHSDLQTEISVVGNFPLVLVFHVLGTPEQRDMIEGMIRGEVLVGFGLTEPDHGSDATWLDLTFGIRQSEVVEFLVNPGLVSYQPAAAISPPVPPAAPAPP